MYPPSSYSYIYQAAATIETRLPTHYALDTTGNITFLIWQLTMSRIKQIEKFL